jgi:DNA-binding NarL/FixJ family response regulator
MFSDLLKMDVIVTDDHNIFRTGIKSILSHIDFVATISEAENGRQAIEIMHEKKHQVIFMDICMPVMDGISATRCVLRDFPDTKIIALTMYEDQRHVIEMIESGASGYLIKNTDDDEIRSALIQVMNDEIYISKQLSKELIKLLLSRHQLKKNKNNDLLSNREKEILKLICRELTSKEIGETLFISEKTVDWHRLNLLEKTHSKNIAGLVLFAIKNGIIEELMQN